MEEEQGQLSILVQNPLLFEHIVERIIFYMDWESLPSCRLVSRQWEKYALPKLLQNVHKIPVVFRGHSYSTDANEVAQVFRNHDGDPNLSKIPRYLAYISQKPRLIFKDFTLKNIPVTHPLVGEFMWKSAAEITDLKFQFQAYNSTAMKNLLDYLRNLKRLTVNCVTVADCPLPLRDVCRVSNLKRLSIIYDESTYTNSKWNYFMVCDLLGACQFLEELSFGDRIPWAVLQKQFLFALRVCSRFCRNTLVEISVGGMDSENLEYLHLDDIKLKVLRCQSLVLSDGDGRFSRVLEKYKNTLESVVVGEVSVRTKSQGGIAWNANGAYEITFPEVMPKLKVFQMGLPAPSSHAALGTGRIRFSPVNFPVQLPSLEKLILYDRRQDWHCPSNHPEKWEGLTEFFEDSDPHPKLSELCLPFASSKLRKSIGAVLPEITSLTLEVGLHQNLKKLWTMWPGLKSLNLTLNGDRKKIENPMAAQAQESSKDLDSNLRSIVNLKDLKHFKLRMIGDCSGSSWSDFRVSQAFCKMPCLEFMLLSHYYNISEEETKELLKYHSLLKKVDCLDHPEVYKIQREYLPNNFIPVGFSSQGASQLSKCGCYFS